MCWQLKVCFNSNKVQLKSAALDAPSGYTDSFNSNKVQLKF